MNQDGAVPSPSLLVASPLWIWTCSSFASEEMCWWDTRGVELIRQCCNVSQVSAFQALTHLICLRLHDRDNSQEKFTLTVQSKRCPLEIYQTRETGVRTVVVRDKDCIGSAVRASTH